MNLKTDQQNSPDAKNQGEKMKKNAQNKQPTTHITGVPEEKVRAREKKIDLKNDQTSQIW